MATLTLDTFSLDAKPQFKGAPVAIRPFLIQGSPTGISPANPTRLNTVYTTKTETPSYSTNPAEYTSVIKNTRNIIRNDYCIGTELVDLVDTQTPRYDFAFAGIHTNDLGLTAAHPVVAVLSLVFSKAKHVYHIQIPLCVGKEANPFLRCWMDATETEPSYSINQLFTFTTPKVEFDRYTFQMKYNRTSTTIAARNTGIASFIGKYTLCVVKTPQYVLGGQMLDDFVKNDFASGNDLFNFAMYDLLGIANPLFPLQLSSDLYMQGNIASTYPKPTFYQITTTDITQQKEGFGNRLLNDVKCYPIDLASQVDSAGAITIDEDSLKPIDPRINKAPDNPDVPLVPQSTFSYTSLFLVLGIVIGFLLIFAGTAYYILKPTAKPGTSLAMVGAAAAIVIVTQALKTMYAVTDPAILQGVSDAIRAAATAPPAKNTAFATEVAAAKAAVEAAAAAPAASSSSSSPSPFNAVATSITTTPLATQSILAELIPLLADKDPEIVASTQAANAKNPDIHTIAIAIALGLSRYLYTKIDPARLNDSYSIGMYLSILKAAQDAMLAV